MFSDLAKKNLTLNKSSDNQQIIQKENYTLIIKNIDPKNCPNLKFEEVRKILTNNFPESKLVKININPAGLLFLNFFDRESIDLIHDNWKKTLFGNDTTCVIYTKNFVPEQKNYLAYFDTFRYSLILSRDYIKLI